jgi:outer membrane protein assembly factor BamB
MQRSIDFAGWVAEYAVNDASARDRCRDGKVIAATLDGRLLALDATNGELLWSGINLLIAVSHTPLQGHHGL